MDPQTKSFLLTPELHRYLLDHSSPLDEVATELIAETAELGDVSLMQIAPEQGLLLTILTRLTAVRRAVEVGTFTGFSALCIARGLAEDGRLLCCDVSEEWTGVGRRAWERAGLADRIDLRIGPALDTLRELPADEEIDLAFVDADKQNYVAYYDELVPRLRPNGLLLVDNTLWFGSVADPAQTDESVEAIRALNRRAAGDDRVDVVLLPVGDGLTVVRRR